MATVTIEGDELVIGQSLIESVLSLRSELRFPLACVTGITADPTIGSEPKGVRAPGTQVPGLLTAGTFHRDGNRAFWNIRRGTHAVVITLEGAQFDQLVIDVGDPYAVVTAVNSARSWRPHEGKS